MQKNKLVLTLEHMSAIWRETQTYNVQRTRLEEERKSVMRSVSIKEKNSGFPSHRICGLFIKVIDPEQSDLVIGVAGGRYTTSK
jgi:hypothetical protein